MIKRWWRKLDSAGTYRMADDGTPMWLAIGPMQGARYGGFTVRVWNRGFWVAPYWWKE